MSVYFVKGRGWRYDFTRKGTRHTAAWFKTKRLAKAAEEQRRKELARAERLESEKPETPAETVTDFLTLVNRRLDHVRAYNSSSHYRDHRGMAKRWVARWGDLKPNEIRSGMIEAFVLERAKVSAYTANKEIRLLRALFNFARKRKWLKDNPTDGVSFLPVEKRRRYVPSQEDIERVIEAADPETRDYLITIRDTLGRMSEINRLRWDDVDLAHCTVTLYTRKKRGGHLTPRRVPMTRRLFEVLGRRHRERHRAKPWVFWHRYWSRKQGRWVEGPYSERKKVMKTLCRKAGVRYFRFHAMRHAGASLMDSRNVPLGSIQRILGHENRTTTEIYLHSIGQAEREAVAVFERESGKVSHAPLTQ